MEEGGCCVCSEATAEGENVIVYCDGPNCNLGTHKGELFLTVPKFRPGQITKKQLVGKTYFQTFSCIG